MELTKLEIRWDGLSWIMTFIYQAWPKINYVKRYQEHQQFGPIQHVPSNELNVVVKPWTFIGWATDIICMIHPLSWKGHN
jgi:hypothetical protein